MLTIRFKRLHPDAKIPTYAHPGDAGLDLFATERTVVRKGEVTKVSTGIALEIPAGYVGLMWDKSSLSTQHQLASLGGVIDCGYRGEMIAVIYNAGNKDYVFEKHQKVAQLLIQRIEQAYFEEVHELSNTSRGTGGFGSTGTH